MKFVGAYNEGEWVQLVPDDYTTYPRVGEKVLIKIRAESFVGLESRLGNSGHLVFAVRNEGRLVRLLIPGKTSHFPIDLNRVEKWRSTGQRLAKDDD